MSKYNALTREQKARKDARREAMGDGTKKVSNRMELEFEKMMNMSESEIANRITEIEQRKEVIKKEALGRAKAKDVDNQNDIIVELAKENKKLTAEQKRLEAFPKVKNQVLKIREIRDKEVERRKVNYEKAKEDLEIAKKEANRVNEIDEELKQLDKQSEEFANKVFENGQIPEEEKIAANERARKHNELLAEKNKLKSEEKSENKVEIAQKRVEEYEKGVSKEDKTINKCNMAWKMLVAGKSWDEINLAAIESENAKKKEETAKEDVHEEVKDGKEKTTGGSETEHEAGDETESKEEFELPGVRKVRTRTQEEEEINELLDNNGAEAEEELEEQLEEENDEKGLTKQNRFLEAIKGVPVLNKLVNKIGELRTKLFGSREQAESGEAQYARDIEQDDNIKIIKKEAKSKPEVETTKKETEPVVEVDSKDGTKSTRDQFIDYLQKMAERADGVEPKAGTTETQTKVSEREDGR